LNDNLQKLIKSDGNPTELYNHTYKEGKRNESTYENFLNAWLNAQLRDILFRDSYTAFLKNNPNLDRVLSFNISMNDDGTISTIRFGKPNDLIDNYGIEDLIANRLTSMPKVFVPLPEDLRSKTIAENANIKVIEGRAWQFNLPNPYSKSLPSQNTMEFRDIFPLEK